MKRVIKLISLLFLGVIGTLSIVIGGMFLFGGFNEKPVYAETLTFSTGEVITSGTFGLQIDTSTKDVNMTTLTLETGLGGDAIIDYPKNVTLGKNFRIVPKKLVGTNTNKGGYVELFAKYAGTQSNQGVVAVCKILIDVDIESVSLIMPKTVIEGNETMQIASRGDPISDLVNIAPSNALLPYLSRNVFKNPNENSKFSEANLTNKKLILTVFSKKDNPDEQTNENVVRFAIGSQAGAGSSSIELPYEYDEDLGEFVFSQDIYITSGSSMQYGEMCLRAYYCSSYTSQQSVNLTNFKEKATTSTLSRGIFNITEYSVRTISMNTIDKFLFLNEETRIYLNNPDANGLNLAINLLNTNSIDTFDPSIYRNNLYISVENGENFSYILSKSNGDHALAGRGLNAYVDEDGRQNIPVEELFWTLKLTDFYLYHRYTNSKIDANKVRIKIEYYAGGDLEPIVQYFYIKPAIYEVTALDVKSTNDDEQDKTFYTKSGSVFQLTQSNFDYDYTTTPTYTDLAYYIPDESYGNIINTRPTSSGAYVVRFNFVLPINSVISFEKLGTWGTISSSITFTQNGNTSSDTKIYTLTVGTGGIQAPANPVEFSAGKKILCEMQLDVTDYNKLSSSLLNERKMFKVTYGDSQTIDIQSDIVKFYTKTGEVVSSLPILVINEVSYAVEYEFYITEEGKYLYITKNAQASTYVVSGIGSFNMLAQVVYFEETTGDVYWLGVQTLISVYTYTDLTALKVYKYNASNGNTTDFGLSDISFDENLGDQFLYLTCESEQLEALKKYYDNGKIMISFLQDFSVMDEISRQIYNNTPNTKLNDINKNAVTFGTLTEMWKEVKVDGKFVGCYIKYSINSVFSIEYNNNLIDNLFNLRIFIETDAEDMFAKFVRSPEVTNDALTFKIKDRVVTTTELYLGRTANTNGRTENTPITLTAIIDSTSGDFEWKVEEDVANASESIELTCNFKYKNSEDRTTSYITPNLTIPKTANTNSVSDIGLFYQLNLGDSSFITFKNVPYFTDGVLVRLHIYANSSSNEINPTPGETQHYKWSEQENGFVVAINDEISFEQGASLYFKLIGLPIFIEANQATGLVGSKDEEFSLFDPSDNSALFTFTGSNASDLNRVKDFTNIFTVHAVSSYMSVNPLGTMIIVDNDLLYDEEVNISFSYANNTQITFKGNSGADVQSYSQTILGAFDIAIEEIFSAPTTENTFVTITRKDNFQDAVQSGEITVQIDYDDEISSSVVEITTDNKLTFKPMTGAQTARLIITFSLQGTELEKSLSVDITINSLFNESDVVIGKTTPGEIDAGYNNGAVIGSGISFAQDSDIADYVANISNIEFSFEDKNTDERITASEHMRVLSGQLGFYSTDLNFDKIINVTLTIIFSGGGTFEVTKEVIIRGNLTITNNIATAYQSGDTISFSSGTFTLSRKNDDNPPQITYTENDLDFEEIYFTESNINPENILELKVNYSSVELPTGTYSDVTVTLMLRPNDVQYDLYIVMTFTLSISVF